MTLSELVLQAATGESLTRTSLVAKVLRLSGTLVAGTENPGPTDEEIETAVDAAIADASVTVRAE